MKNKVILEQINELNGKFKDKLMYNIQATKVKDYYTGDRKDGKYHNEYHAKTKSGQDIYTTSLKELEKRLSKEIYR